MFIYSFAAIQKCCCHPFIRVLAFSSSPKTNFPLFEYLCFFIHSCLVHKSKNRKTIIIKIELFQLCLNTMFWYKKTQSRSFFSQLETEIQWLWKLGQKIICDEKIYEKYWKSFLLLSRFKGVLAGTFSEIK